MKYVRTLKFEALNGTCSNEPNIKTTLVSYIGNKTLVFKIWRMKYIVLGEAKPH